jgi:hypothetical protein
MLPGGVPFGEHPRVKLFMKGVFNTKTPMPRYSEIWDTNSVLKLLKSKEWCPAGTISLMKLSQKVATLILICTGQRPQILRALRTDEMNIDGEKFVFTIKNSQVKQGRLGYNPEPLVLKSFPEDKRICVYSYLRFYDNRGKEKLLFLTLKKPHNAATQDTLSRWVKGVLKDAGLDISKYRAGSVRAAATSKARHCGATLDEILKGGGWSQETTFSRWYSRPIVKHKRTIGEIILK